MEIVIILVIIVLIMIIRGGKKKSKQTELEIEKLEREKNDPNAQADALIKWKQLLADGDITDEEYQIKRNEILGKK